ncbi:tumor suppressor, Mitostatin-domain-containing protein [Pavlovales sp. CCMP2436]|nr:tumor suppressor, Mitostatin-domain-containing protein [Pavlovales sp. CCMP2436]|mmetsp:Transcript_43025/g.100972  ORF Transcript_43025/g.100972 Transcript_43025/m.100972 type:complete len:496 (+) Transcript_43025:3577-5064(+)
MSRARYLSKVEAQRTMEARTETLTKDLNWNRTLAENFRSDERVEKMRGVREEAELVHEMEKERSLAAGEREARKNAIVKAQDEALATELHRRKIELTRDLKMKQRVVETSPEIRELEAQLKQAYMNKERHVQVAEKERQMVVQQGKERVIDEQMELARQQGIMAEAYREHMRRQDQLAASDDLKTQMADSEARRQAAYTEFLREKAQVDAIIAKIQAEDEAEHLARMHKQSETKEYIAHFVQEREQLKRQREEMLEEENRKILEFAAYKMAREQAAEAAKAGKQEARDRIAETIADDIMRRNAERDEMEQLRNELASEEAEEKRLADEHAEFEKRIRMRLEMQRANAYQKALKAMKREEEKAEEDIFRSEMLSKFAEDDRVEQMNAQKRRQKQMEHRHEIERLLDLRRAAFAEERANAEAEQEAAEEREAERMFIVEDERQRILRAHAAILGLHDLPKGVLKSQADAALFSQNGASVDELRTMRKSRFGNSGGRF